MDSSGRYYQSMSQKKAEKERRFSRRSSIFGSMEDALGVPSLDDDSITIIGDSNSLSHPVRSPSGRYFRRGCKVDDERNQPYGYRTLLDGGTLLSKKQHHLFPTGVGSRSPGSTTSTTSTATLTSSTPATTKSQTANVSSPVSGRSAVLLPPAAAIVPPLTCIDERPICLRVVADWYTSPLSAKGSSHNTPDHDGKRMPLPPDSPHTPSHSNNDRGNSERNNGGGTLRNLVWSATPQGAKKTLRIFSDQLKRGFSDNRIQVHSTTGSTGTTVDDRPIPYSIQQSHSEVEDDDNQDDDIDSVLSYEYDFQHHAAGRTPSLTSTERTFHGRSDPRTHGGLLPQRRGSITKYSIDEPSSFSTTTRPASSMPRKSTHADFQIQESPRRPATIFSKSKSERLSSSCPSIKKPSLAKTLLCQKRGSRKITGSSIAATSRHHEEGSEPPEWREDGRIKSLSATSDSTSTMPSNQKVTSGKGRRREKDVAALYFDGSDY